jgi:hypothetical protein
MRKALWAGMVLGLVVLGIGGYLVLSPTEGGLPLQAKLDPRQIELRGWMAQVIKQDPRNSGVEISMHYEGFDAEVLVFDLQKISGTNSRADVFRVFYNTHRWPERITTERFTSHFAASTALP